MRCLFRSGSIELPTEPQRHLMPVKIGSMCSVDNESRTDGDRHRRMTCKQFPTGTDGPLWGKLARSDVHTATTLRRPIRRADASLGR